MTQTFLETRILSPSQDVNTIQMKAKGGRKVQGNAVLVHWENLGLAATSATLAHITRFQ